METYWLYLNAAKLGKRVDVICSISDNLITKEILLAEERSSSILYEG